MDQPLIARLQKDKPLLGTLLTTDSTELAEALTLAGWGWFFIDLEHSAMQFSAAQRVIQAIAARAYTVIRVPDHTAGNIKKALDMGCDGIIVPLVNSATEASQIVSLSKYSPLGERSVGIGRAQGYGIKFQEYIQSANQHVAVIVQIEHREAIENLDTILQVKGIDGIFVGPYDLSASMGLMGQVSHPDVAAAIAKVRERCRSKEIPFGIYCATAEKAALEIKEGCKLVAIGTDLSHAVKSASDTIKQFQS